MADRIVIDGLNNCSAAFFTIKMIALCDGRTAAWAVMRRRVMTVAGGVGGGMVVVVW